jgi:hypothetical protein
LIAVETRLLIGGELLAGGGAGEGMCVRLTAAARCS